MKDTILIELAARWEREAVTPDCLDVSEEDAIGDYIEQGNRKAKRECADTLRILVSMLGDS